MMSEISQVVKNRWIMTTNTNSNIQIKSANIEISCNVKNYMKWQRHYYAGINPFYNSTIEVFELGGLWYIHGYGGNYTSSWDNLYEASKKSAEEQVDHLRKEFALTGEDDGENTYSLEFSEQKEISLTIPMKGVEVINGPIARAIAAEKQWREEHMICDESVVEQVLDAIGRYEFVDCPRGLHNCIVKADDGKLYSIDVSKSACRGHWVYSARIEAFFPEKEASERKAFGRKVKALSAISGVPFDVVKMLGVQMSAPEVKQVLRQLKAVHDMKKSREQLHELSCGIARRKAELKRLLPEEVYTFFGVDYLGQERSWRLANYVAE